MYAVYLDYEYDGTRNSVVLGGSISHSRDESGMWLDDIAFLSGSPVFSYVIDEDALPAGYKFQTYYVAAYDPIQPALGMH